MDRSATAARSLLALSLALAAAGCNTAGFDRPVETLPPAVHRTSAGVEYEILASGAWGATTAGSGDRVAVHYVGTLADGTPFDSTRERGVPLEFHLDRGEVLPGLDDGVFGMRVGERRLLRIPPELAYGDQGVAGQVPPGATLVLEVELVDLQQ